MIILLDEYETPSYGCVQEFCSSMSGVEINGRDGYFGLIRVSCHHNRCLTCPALLLQMNPPLQGDSLKGRRKIWLPLYALKCCVVIVYFAIV